MLRHDYKLTFKCVMQFIIAIFYAAIMLYQNNPLPPTHPTVAWYVEFHSLVTTILLLEMVNQWQQISS